MERLCENMESTCQAALRVPMFYCLLNALSSSSMAETLSFASGTTGKGLQWPYHWLALALGI